jgi:hypothetical protein
LTKDKRDRADTLDIELENAAVAINAAFAKLDSQTLKNDFDKWKWLGIKLDEIIQRLLKDGLLDQSDIDNNAIWPGFGQFFGSELRRGMGTRRSGDNKDHYRKCWLLATTPHTSWIRIWAGWDAFVDRGEQLVGSHKLMPLLEHRLKGVKLSKENYQDLAREIANELPSGARAATISAMSDNDLSRIIEKVCDRVLKDSISYRNRLG